MSVRGQDQQPFVEAARRVYDGELKEQLEKEHFGKVIAVEPESGDYVLGETFLDVDQTCQERFGTTPVYFFRVGGGGAMKIRGAVRRERLPG